MIKRLSDEIIDECIELRKTRHSIGQISKLLAIPTVTIAANITDRLVAPKVICRQCHKEFFAAHQADLIHRFCSDECCTTYHRELSGDCEEKYTLCAFCGEEIRYPHDDKPDFCSIYCAGKASRIEHFHNGHKSYCSGKETEEAIKLRKRGLGYSEIADKLNVSVSNVVNGCVIKLTAIPEKCAYCGKTVLKATIQKREKRFCNNKCCTAWYRSRPEGKGKRVAKCVGCGKEFTYYENGITRKFCSRQCANKTHLAVAFSEEQDALIRDRSQSIYSLTKLMPHSYSTIEKRRWALMASTETEAKK